MTGKGQQEVSNICGQRLLTHIEQDRPQQCCQRLTFIQEETPVAFWKRERERLFQLLAGLGQVFMCEVSQGHQDPGLKFASCTLLRVRFDLPALEQAQRWRRLPLCDQQASKDVCFSLLLNKTKVLTELCYDRRPALRLRQVRNRQRVTRQFCQHLSVEIVPVALLRQHEKLLQ